MTDYLKIRNERNVAQIVQNFSNWERGLHGWQIWDYAVSLEPPFSSVKSPVPLIIAPIRDDARLQSGLGRLFGKSQITTSQRQLSTASPEQTTVKPAAFYRSEPLAELGIILPKDFDISSAVCEQFFLSLSNFSAPVSFEILADSNLITFQFACDNALSSHLKNQLKTFFPDCIITEKEQILKSYLTSQAQTVIADFGLARQFLLPLQTFRSFSPDPLTGLISSLGNLQPNEKAVVQILFQKAKQNWAEEINKLFTNQDFKSAFSSQIPLLREKFSSPLFAVSIRLAVENSSKAQSWNILRRIGNSFSQFSTPNGNELIALDNSNLSANNHFLSVLNRTSYRSGMLLNTAELASFAHLPSSSVRVAKLKRDSADTKAAPVSALNNALILGINDHQETSRQVTLSNEQRTKHLHFIGSSGSGKSTLLLNLIKQDLENGEGLCVIDPHGDLIDDCLANVPDKRIKDVILFDPADSEFPIGFNILRATSELEKQLLSSDLIATFREMATSWGDVMDSVLANAILVFLESSKGGTLFDLKRFLVEKEFRQEFLKTVEDDTVNYFWQNEFPLISGKPQSSILIRLDSFLRNRLMRNIVCQKENKLDFRNIMDGRKVLFIKLSQGLIGKENAHLLGTLLVSKLYQTALSRQDTKVRPFFWLYMDEFHHFITPSMESILSGVRKYNIGLHLAHQEFRQLQSRNAEVASSVLSNCYTRICFRLGDSDAERFASGFSFFDSNALQNLSVGDAIGRVERADFDFNLKTERLSKVEKTVAEQRRRSIVQQTREHFALPKAEVEAQIILSREKEVPTKTSEMQPAKPETVKPTPAQSTNVSRQNKDEEITVSSEVSSLPDYVSHSDMGNQQHRYLQSLVKRMAESKGFRAEIEKQLYGGLGRIDVALAKEDLKIACEISVTNEVGYEAQNIRKCLSGGYSPVVMLSGDNRHLEKIKQFCEKDFAPEEFGQMRFFSPEEFHLWLENLSDETIETEEKVKGFKVKVKVKPASKDEALMRKKAITDVVFGTLKNLKKKISDK